MSNFSVEWHECGVTECVMFGISPQDKTGHKQTQLDHMKSVTKKLKAILPLYIVFVKISELGIHLYM